MDSGEPLPFELFNLVQRRSDRASLALLSFYRWNGLIGDINVKRTDRVLSKASMFAFNQWGQKEVLRLLKNRDELENLQKRIENEIEECACETKEHERQIIKDKAEFYATAINKNRRFNEAISRLPKSKEENLLILRELLGFP